LATIRVSFESTAIYWAHREMRPLRKVRHRELSSACPTRKNRVRPTARPPGHASFAVCRCGTKSGPNIHEAFLSLACALICWQSLRRRWRTA